MSEFPAVILGPETGSDAPGRLTRRGFLPQEDLEKFKKYMATS